MLLPNFVCGEWKEGSGAGQALLDPVTGEELARVSSEGIDLGAALAFARKEGGPALRKFTYAQRADMLVKIAAVLTDKRSEYFRISLLNSGATEADASFDVDGAIYTLKYYGKAGKALGEHKMLEEGAAIPLSKTNVFAAQHFLTPLEGAAVFINAFNFPAWGLCEKAAVALLAGIPVVVKPATPTAWLTQRIVEDIVKAEIVPRGALSIISGPARDLLDHVREEDMVSFTGSADTARKVRSHENVLRRSVRVNIEADSINSAILGPDGAPGTELFNLIVREVVKEMTLKAGQKCTAIRRVMAPQTFMKELGEAIAAKLAGVKVGDPRDAEVKMGPVVNKAQQENCREGLALLKKECAVVFGGEESFCPPGIDAAKSAFVQPTLLSCANGLEAKHVHDVEVFGPAATLVPYSSTEELIQIARRGLGSLVASIFSDDATFVRQVVLGIGDLHGRVLAVDSAVGAQHTGHGNVVPSCLHGGPGRAGGGEELAGLRGLLLYHRRFVVQGPTTQLAELSEHCADASLLYS